MESDFNKEKLAIEQRYSRRQTAQIEQRMLSDYSVEEKNRIFTDWIRRANLGDVAQLKLLEIGCGSGAQLQRMLRIGFLPQNITACDLLEERIATARRNLPAEVRLLQSDALKLDIPEATFDVVFQSTVFSSVLDSDYRNELAKKMWRLVRPGGGVLWYDFIYNNPYNPDVRGVGLKQVRQLFTQASEFAVWRLTLLPPLARLVDPISERLHQFLLLFPFLRSHLLVWIRKPEGTAS